MLYSFPVGLPLGSLGIEDIENWAVRHRFPRTLGDGFSQQPFELREILELGANVVEVMFGDLAHLGTRRVFWPSKIEQGADFIEGETQLSPPSDEGECASLFWPIDPMTAIHRCLSSTVGPACKLAAQTIATYDCIAISTNLERSNRLRDFRFGHYRRNSCSVVSNASSDSSPTTE